MRDSYIAQEVGGTLIVENGLVLITGAELVEWYQIHQTHGFHVYDAFPFAPFQTIPDFQIITRGLLCYTGGSVCTAELVK